MATTEAEIVEMGLRLASAGNQVGLTEAEILALSASMSSMGINAEAGGSAMSRVLQKINTEVLSGGENLEVFAQIAGQSAEDFAEKWKSAPQEALVDFIKGLDNINKAGGDVTGTLKALGITSVQELNTLLALSGNTDLLTDSLNMANSAWEENAALTKEADAAMDSAKTKISIAMNSIAEVARVMVERLLPVVGDVMEKIADLAKRFIDLDPSAQTAIAGFIAFLAALGPILFILPKLIAGFTKVKGVLAILKTFLFGATGGVSLFSKAMTLLSGPIGIVIAAVTAFIGVLVYLYNTNETVREFINTAWENIKEVVMAVVGAIAEFMQEAWTWIQEIIQMAMDAILPIIQETWQVITEFLTETMTQIWELIQIVWDFIREHILVVLEAVWQFVVDIWTQITSWLSENQELIRSTIETVWNSIKSIVEGVMSVIVPIVQGAWDAIQKVSQLAMDYLVPFLKDKWEMIKETISVIWEGIKSIVETTIGIIQSIIELVMNIISGNWSAAWENVKEIANGVWENIKTIVDTAINLVKSTVGRVLGQIKDKFAEIWTAIKETVQQKFNDVVNAVKRGMQNAYDAVTNFFGRFREAGGKIISNIADGIKGAIGKVTGAIGSVLQAARDLLPFSPPKDKSSPMVDIHKNGITGQIAKGILSGKRDIDQAMRSVLNPDLAFASGMVNSNVQHHIGTVELNQRPLEVSLSMGERTYRGFSDDINRAQGKTIELKELM